MGTTELWLVRHGESLGNVAASEADAAGAEMIPIDMRDADVPLSPTGEQQAAALGGYLRGLPQDQVPQTVWSSPYARAVQTADVALREAGLPRQVRIDERLRDRELGVLDLLTHRGVNNRFPAEAARRRWLGKFYYRPPGGESWADLALRVRSVLLDLERPDVPDRALLVCHDAMILIFRYVCEGMGEADLMAVARSGSVRNASVTRLVRPNGTGWWTADMFNADDHLQVEGVPATEHPAERDALAQ